MMLQNLRRDPVRHLASKSIRRARKGIQEKTATNQKTTQKGNQSDTLLNLRMHATTPGARTALSVPTQACFTSSCGLIAWNKSNSVHRRNQSEVDKKKKKEYQ